MLHKDNQHDEESKIKLNVKYLLHMEYFSNADLVKTFCLIQRMDPSHSVSGARIRSWKGYGGFNASSPVLLDV